MESKKFFFMIKLNLELELTTNCTIKRYNDQCLDSALKEIMIPRLTQITH